MIYCVLPDMFFILIMEMVDSDLLCLTRHVFYLDMEMVDSDLLCLTRHVFYLDHGDGGQ